MKMDAEGTGEGIGGGGADRWKKKGKYKTGSYPVEEESGLVCMSLNEVAFYYTCRGWGVFLLNTT